MYRYEYIGRLFNSPQSVNFRCAFYCLKIESESLDVEKDFCASRISKPPPLPKAKYGGESFATLLTGNTFIGEQGASFIKTLFNAVKVPVVFEHIPVGNSLEYVTSVMRNGTALHVDLQHDPSVKAKTLCLNSMLGLYACIVKMRSYEGFNCKFPNLKITTIIQNISGDFSKLEYEPVKGVVETLKFCQDTEIRRYLHFVFGYAQKNNHKKITFALQTREVPLADGMFLDIAVKLQSCHFPDIPIEYMPINRVVRLLVMQPQIFDLICTNDRYGTFITSVCCSICGGASLFSATEWGDAHAVFKPLQTKLSITDCRELSPYGIVRAAIDLLEHLENKTCAKKIEKELMDTMMVHCIKTPEFGGKDNGEFVICSLVNNLKTC